MIPDKEFKFYLGSILILYVLIYAAQATMIYRYSIIVCMLVPVTPL